MKKEQDLKFYFAFLLTARTEIRLCYSGTSIM